MANADGSLGPVDGQGYQPPPYTGDAAAWIRQVRTDLGLLASQTSHQGLETIVRAAQQVGAPITMDQVDSNGHLGGLVINGQKMQLIDGNNQWVDPTPWPTKSGGGQGATTIDPTYLQPFTQQFQAPGQATLPGANNPPGQSFTYPDFQLPSSFQAPTADSIKSNPAYQFRENEAINAVQNSAAGKGLLNSGGTIYDIANTASGLASQEYDNIWNRDFGLWNQDTQNAIGAYGLSRANAAGNFGINTSTADDAYNRAWQQYQNARDTFYANQSNPFNKIIASSGAQG